MMMNQGGMVPSDPYAQQQAQYQQPMSRGANVGADFSTPTNYTGEFSYDKPYTPPGTDEEVGTTDSGVPEEVEVESAESCEARGMKYNSSTGMCEMPTDDREKSQKQDDEKRLQDMVAEQQSASRVAIDDMNTKEQLLEAYQGAEMAKYMSMGVAAAFNPVVGIISRIFSGNQSEKIKAKLEKDFPGTVLPEVDYKNGILGGALGGSLGGSLGSILDKTIVKLQDGSLLKTKDKTKAKTTYQAKFKPSNSDMYGNNLGVSAGTYSRSL